VFIASDLAAAPDDLRAFAAAVTDALDGHVDIVVHNAALCPAVDTPGLTEADLEATLAVNIRAPHVLTAALAPPMAERGTGVIIVIRSWMATVGSPYVGLYSATKAAEAQLARSWSAEFGPRGSASTPSPPRSPAPPSTTAAATSSTRSPPPPPPDAPSPPRTWPPPWPGSPPTTLPSSTVRRSRSTAASPQPDSPDPAAHGQTPNRRDRQRTARQLLR